MKGVLEKDYRINKLPWGLLGKYSTSKSGQSSPATVTERCHGVVACQDELPADLKYY